MQSLEEIDFAQGMYSHVMKPFHDPNLTGSKSLYAFAKEGFEKHLTKVRGRVPRTGVPFKEFLSWIPVRKDNEKFFHIVHSLFFWNFHRLKLNIPNEITKQVAASEAPELIPVEILYRLPQWSQWIGFNLSFKDDLGIAGAQEVSHGAFVSFMPLGNVNTLNVALQISDSDSNTIQKDNYGWVNFSIALDKDRPIDETIITEMDKGMFSHLPNSVEVIHKAKSHLIKTILFIASMEPTEPSESAYFIPYAPRTGKVYKFVPRLFPRNIEVGTEYVAQVREFTDSVNKNSVSRRAHIRCAHWHRYWTGPKTNQKLVLKWIAPCVISGKE